MSQRDISLITGLRNPGEQYAKTRHNVGFWFIEELSKHYLINFSTHNKFKADVGRTTIHGKLIWLVRPNTYMNLSGEAIAPIATYYKIPVNEILVVHDELDLPVGCARLKMGGGHGGHNGLRNITQKLGSNHFSRLRIGIDHPGTTRDVSEYVLQKPTNDDKTQIENAIEYSLKIIPDLINGNFQKAMATLHGEIPNNKSTKK